jgi:RNA polymerase sigma-54 factor
VVFSLELAMVPRVGLEVSPALVMFGEMLMLPYDAMQAAIEDELAGNTALERLESGDCPVCLGTWRIRCPVCSGWAPADNRGPATDRVDTAAGEPDTHALSRAVRAEVGTAAAPVAEYLVGCLDEHGFLDRSSAALAAELAVPEPVVARVVEAIRKVGPPGVGASGVTECLLLQLDALGTDEDLVRAVISEHLPALAKGHFAAIAAALSVSRDEVRRVLEFIQRRLRPYPAFNGNTAPRTRYVVPDVVVRPHEELPDEFAVALVEPAMNRLRVRRDSRTRDESGPQARSFLALLRDRWETLLRVAEFAVERQKDFLRNGASALLPLTRAEAAAALDLHESTMSRAVADKFVLLPDRTIVPLSRFFGVSGGVDEELRRLLASADGPVSDQRLADQLCAAGYPIARRTVAKHRARLGFASTALR